MTGTEIKDNLNELQTLIDDSKTFTLLAEDWKQGLVVKHNVTGREVKNHIADMRKSYGDNFAFRVFNSELDLHWNGELGIVLQPLQSEEEQDKPMSLVSDEQQHPVAAKLKGYKLTAKLNDDDRVRFVQLTKEAT